MVGHTCLLQSPQQQVLQPRKRQTPRKVVKEWKPKSMIREPAPDVPESSIQNQLRATSPHGAKGKMPQFEIVPQGQMLAPIQCPKEKTQRGETRSSPNFNLTNFPLLGLWPRKNESGETQKKD